MTTTYTIREGEVEEIEKFALFNEDNDGDEIIVAENEAGEVVAFAQVTENTIYFLESESKGAGTAIVNSMKDRYSYLLADHTDKNSETYWEKQGFTRCAPEWGRQSANFEWYAE